MSVVPLGGLIGSATGTPMAQTQGSEVERDQRESAAQARKVDLVDQSERAQGVGQTKEDHDISERDADGRRPWETTLRLPRTTRHPEPMIRSKVKIVKEPPAINLM